MTVGTETPARRAMVRKRRLALSAPRQGEPGRLTQLCSEYCSGKVSWDTLVDEVCRRRPTVDLTHHYAWWGHKRFYGTWEEIEMAVDDGLLSADECLLLPVERDRCRADEQERVLWR